MNIRAKCISFDDMKNDFCSSYINDAEGEIVLRYFREGLGYTPEFRPEW